MKKTFSVRLPSLVAVLLGISLFTSQTISHATTIIHTPFARMCQEADAIVEATVSSVSSRSLDDPSVQFPEIVTDVVLTNITAIKGNRPTTFTLTYSGGTVGGITMIVPGMPRFEVGERKVLFLREGDVLFGVWEGTFTVVVDPTGIAMLQRADGGWVSEFDEATGELILYTPQMNLSKAVPFLDQDMFRQVIRNFIRTGEDRKEVSE